MKLDDWITSTVNKVVEAAMSALQETADRSVNQTRSNLPANRIKTRRAVRYRRVTVRGYGPRLNTVVGLDFSKKYPIRKTRTEQLIRLATKPVREVAASQFRGVFMSLLKALSS